MYPELDIDFTPDELKTVFKKVKQSKSAGMDYLLNEYFIEFQEFFTPLLLKLFNRILHSGCYPKSWSCGMIIPLYKKGNVNETGNYRGITLLSHLSKIFTSLLNNRLLA